MRPRVRRDGGADNIRMSAAPDKVLPEGAESEQRSSEARLTDPSIPSRRPRAASLLGLSDLLDLGDLGLLGLVDLLLVFLQQVLDLGLQLLLLVLGQRRRSL